jgi:hypothetical protein
MFTLKRDIERDILREREIERDTKRDTDKEKREKRERKRGGGERERNYVIWQQLVEMFTLKQELLGQFSSTVEQKLYHLV